MNKVTTSPSKKFVSFLRSGIRKIVYRPTAVDFVFSAGAACRTATMNKRLQRLISEIQQSKDVGIVMNRDIPAEEIKEFIDSLSRLSPSCAFHVLNVRHSETQSRVTWKKVSGTGRHSIREVWFNDTHPAGNMEDGNAEWWLGNYRIWKKMLIRAFVLRKKKQKEDKV